jgi:hypothetical protein
LVPASDPRSPAPARRANNPRRRRRTRRRRSRPSKWCRRARTTTRSRSPSHAQRSDPDLHVACRPLRRRRRACRAARRRRDARSRSAVRRPDSSIRARPPGARPCRCARAMELELGARRRSSKRARPSESSVRAPELVGQREEIGISLGVFQREPLRMNDRSQLRLALSIGSRGAPAQPRAASRTG